MKPVKTQPRFQMESCGLCLHPYVEHFDVNSQPDFCCDGCREYMTHQEYAENPLFWCLNSYDQTTIVDGNNRVVDSRQVLKLLQSYTGERDALKAEVAKQSDIPLCGFHQRIDATGTLVLTYTNGCVACSLNQLNELLELLASSVTNGEYGDSIDTLRQLIVRQAESERIKESE